MIYKKLSIPVPKIQKNKLNEQDKIQHKGI